MWPLEKQRRCRIDWEYLLSPSDARIQESFERSATVLAMRESGLKFHEIGEMFGVGVERARQLWKVGERRRRFGVKSPLEKISADTMEFRVTRDEKRRLVVMLGFAGRVG